jgi:hypothetical protein
LDGDFDHGHKELILAILNSWDEVKSDRRYLSYFLDGRYDRGGPGSDDLIILVGKSQTPDAVKVLSRFFAESENNPYGFDTVCTAVGYHGSEDFLSKLRSLKNKMPDDTMLQWAYDRCSKKTTSLPPDDMSKGKHMRFSPSIQVW